MRLLKRLLTMSLPFMMMAACSSTPAGNELPADKPETPPSEQPSTPDPEPSSISSVEFAESLAPGWNLGNQFDAYNNGVAAETAWGIPKLQPSSSAN